MVSVGLKVHWNAAGKIACLFLQDYGAKLVINATDQITEKTFFNILVKIRSVTDNSMFTDQQHGGTCNGCAWITGC